MKTVKAKVLSSTPIRISKAASILSKFASTENGASQAIGAYLRRASDAFNELAQVHKEKKSSSSRSHRKNLSGYETEATVNTRAPKQSQEPIQPEPKPEKLSQEPSGDGEEIERKRHKKKGVEKVEFGNSFNEEVILEAKTVEATPVRSGVDGNIDAEGGKKKHKKRRKERGDGGHYEENIFENGKLETVVKFETNDVEATERKKRKSVEVEEGGGIGSEEQRSKKKKRRKSGDGDN
ncbi:transcriptional regulator ATRX [Tripterygium wilfordii]|uniref:Transcriptional regulator ATRX n=1 Tax=Tripterygium wilfordii TaxID=458696 RepID=A0A7J7E2N8_TRIWF|nr:uncharacterized protein LOC119998115 [Tripterygium wilfordii]KAF5752801.1 transcriptional regulator ATRX [Tripterygium wilfordii]